MAYKILYFEDKESGSIKADLENIGFEVDIESCVDTKASIDALKANNHDAYLMDYRLTDGTGQIDAPALAGIIRTESGKDGFKINAPIIMITDESGLKIVNTTQRMQDLFDYVMTKDKFRQNKQRIGVLIVSFITSYHRVLECGFDIPSFLGIDKKEIGILDYRFERDLLSKTGDAFGTTHFVLNYLVRTIGPLVGPDILAARLGVKNAPDHPAWGELMKILSPCLYTGIFNDVYQRWWMKKIEDWWECEFTVTKRMRLLDASQRVELLNKKYGLDLIVAEPSADNDSTRFWTICFALQTPLDPSDGFVIDDVTRREWEEPMYISIEGALNKPQWQKRLSPADVMEVLTYGTKK